MRGIVRRFAASVVLVSMLGAAVPPPAVRTGWTRTTVSISVGGAPRSYLLVRPVDPGTASLPVLMELHGCCTTPDV
jgi:poly(3-hydroxybutyrate) depolymerase